MKKLLTILLLLFISISGFSQYQFPEYIEHIDSDSALIYADQFGGGIKQVASKAARNAIPIQKRAIGMLVSWNEGTWRTGRFEGSDTLDATWINDTNWLLFADSLDLDSIYTLIDTVEAHRIKDSILLQDSLAVHLDTLQAHNTRINNNVDSLSVHLDSLQSHNTRINSIVDSLTNIYTEAQVNTLLAQKKDTNTRDSTYFLLTDEKSPSGWYVAISDTFKFDTTSVNSDLSKRILVFRSNNTDTIFSGIGAADSVAYYKRYIDTSYYLAWSVADSLESDSNLICKDLRWIFTNTYINTNKTGYLFYAGSDIEFVDIRGSLKALAVNGVFDVSDIGNGKNVRIEFDTITSTGGVFTIDVSKTSLVLNNLSIKGSSCKSTGNDACKINVSTIGSGSFVDCNFISTAGNGLYFYGSVSNNDMSIRSKNISGLTYGAYITHRNGGNLRCDIDICNNPFLQSNSTNIGSDLIYTGKMNGATFTLGGGSIVTYGNINGTISLAGSTLALTSVPLQCFSILNDVSINATNTYVYADFRGAVQMSSLGSVIGTIYNNTYLNFYAHQKHEDPGTSGNMYTITAGNVAFKSTASFADIGDDMLSYINMSGTAKVTLDCPMDKFAQNGKALVSQSGGYLKLGKNAVLNNTSLVSSYRVPDNYRLFPSGVFSIGGYISVDGAVFYANNDTASGLFFHNAQDTIQYYSNSFTNSQWQCQSEIVGTTDLTSGYDWSGANADSFAISVNGATIDTVVLNANCANAAAVVSHIKTQLAAEGVIDVEVQSHVNISTYINIYTTNKGSNTSIELTAGGGTALTTLGWSTTPATCNVIETITNSDRGKEIFDVNYIKY